MVLCQLASLSVLQLPGIPLYPGIHTIFIAYRSAIWSRYLQQLYTILELIMLKLRALIAAWLCGRKYGDV